MLLEVEGIVISVVPYGETSKIINVYTQEFGVIGIMCKGALNIKSPVRNLTEKLTLANFNIKYHPHKLSFLESVDVINYFKNTKSDILLISYATYLCDLVSQIVKQSDDKEIYHLFKSALLKIEELLDPLVITNIFEVKILDYLGVGLNLTECALCGRKKEIVALSTQVGGLICKNCYTNEQILPINIIKFLNMYYLVDLKSISKLNIKKDIKKEINNFLVAYYLDYTGLYLKSKDFLKTIQKL